MSATDPYALFLYAMKSPITQEIYVPKVTRFFTFIGLAPPLEEQSRETHSLSDGLRGYPTRLRPKDETHSLSDGLRGYPTRCLELPKVGRY